MIQGKLLLGKSGEILLFGDGRAPGNSSSTPHPDSDLGMRDSGARSGVKGGGFRGEGVVFQVSGFGFGFGV